MARNRYFEDEALTSKFKGKMLLRMFKYAKPYRKTMIGVFVVMLVMGFLALVPPMFNRMIVDMVLPENTSSAPPDGYIKYAWLALSGIAFITVADIIYSFFRNRLMAKVGYSIVHDLRQDLYAHLQKMSFDYFDSRPAGKILVRVTNYVDELANMFASAILGFLIDGIKMILVLVWLFVLDWRFALVIMAVIIPMSVAVMLLRGVLHKRFRTSRNKNSNRTAYIAENINGTFVTKAFNRAELNGEIYSDLNLTCNKAWTNAININELFLPTVELFWYAGVAAVYTVALFFSIRYQNVSVGTITSLVLYLGMFEAPINNISQILQQLSTATSNVERIFETMDTPPMIADKPDAYPLPKIQGNINFDNVTFSYDKKINILENFSLEVPEGKHIALVGPTGAGKSTVVNLIPRFYDLKNGAITIDGHDISQVLLATLRSQIGVMMQDTFMFNGTIMDNIRYGNLDATEEDCINAARTVFVDDLIRNLPNGYNTVVGDTVNSLSTGERQLISFARTLLSDPKILILDEATSSIDTETEEKIQSALDAVLVGRTSFIIAHRLSTIKKADCILYIADKGIAEAGTYEQLMQKKGLFYHLATTQK